VGRSALVHRRGPAPSHLVAVPAVEVRPTLVA
jgi:hypothetical protein